MSFWSSDPAPAAPDTFHLTALHKACVGTGETPFFMGGVGMAAAIEALEHWSGKPLLWATIQFIDHGRLGEDFTLSLETVGGGRRIIQANAQLLRNGNLLQQTMAALGARDSNADRPFAQMPAVPPPEDCPSKPDDAFHVAGNLLDQFESRLAHADEANGIEHRWIRPRFETPMSAALLALMSDFFLGAHPMTRRGTSLDNTFRLCALRETDWVLAVTELSAFTRGAVHGSQRQFARDGTLLSLSSQTGLLPRHP